MPETWPAKDPQAVLDYQYTIPLDEGDAVASSTFTRVAGTVVIDDSDRSGAVWTARLSGGADGETSVFRITWVTTLGQQDEDYVTLPVIAADYVELLYTDYMAPLPQHLVARYPAFAEVATATIQYWLTDSERYVDDSWAEGDYAVAIMALAAHNMALAGLGLDGAASADMPLGVTRLKSGSLDVSFGDEYALARSQGKLSATRYGIEFANLLRRNRAGPRVLPTGTLPYDPLRYPHGEA